MYPHSGKNGSCRVVSYSSRRVDIKTESLQHWQKCRRISPKPGSSQIPLSGRPWMAYIPPQWREGLCHEIKNQTRGRPKIGSLTSLACPSASSGRRIMPSTRRRNADQHRRRRRRNGPHRRAAFTRRRRGANQKAARGGAFRSDLRSCPTPTLVPRSPTES